MAGSKPGRGLLPSLLCLPLRMSGAFAFHAPTTIPALGISCLLRETAQAGPELLPKFEEASSGPLGRSRAMNPSTAGDSGAGPSRRPFKRQRVE